MKSREIARRYAEAIYAVASDAGKVDAVQAELRDIAATIGSDVGFRRLFEHPLATKAEKMELLERAFPKMDESLRNALRVLIHNGREAYLGLILDEVTAVRASSS